MRRATRPLVPLLLLVLAHVAHAQPEAGWASFPALNEAQALAASPDRLWVGANGGVYSFAPASGEITRYTAIDGLQGGELNTVVWDDARDALWIGYADGTIDRLDGTTGEVISVFEIARAERFTARGVRRLRVIGDLLYAATDFGVVVLDPLTRRVRNTYSRLGTLPAAVGVNDIAQAPLLDGRPGLWVATDEGLASAPLDDPNLQVPTPWTVDASFGPQAYSLATLGGSLYAAGGPTGALDVYRLTPAGTWDRQVFSNARFSTLAPDGDALLAQTGFRVFVIRPGQSGQSYVNPSVVNLSGTTVGPDGGRWLTDAAYGLIRLPAAGTQSEVTFPVDAVVPAGPFTNQIVEIDVARDGTLWAVSDPLAGASAISRFADGVWTNTLTTDPGEDLGQRGFRSASVGPDGTFYAGSRGDGLIVIAPDDTKQRFAEANSSLLSAGGTTNFVVVSDVLYEDDDRWVISQESARPLNHFAADGSWTSLPYPSGISSQSGPVRMALDRFGQKWFALGRDGGLMVWDTGSTPADASDDRGRLYRGETARAGSGLPNGDVRDVVVDLQGRVWLGTARGIAYVFSPGSAFGADPALAVPQWPIVTEDGVADWLLRDVTVNDLEVDPSGQIWVGTTSGAYLINTAGNAVVRHLTTANSPLASDAVLGVSVDGRSGTVYLLTDRGLYAAPGDARRPSVDSDELTVAPNPFRPASATAGVLVSGLRDAQSAVRILTPSGEAVYSADVAGGSFRWDGRDSRTGELVPSGVYLVAGAGQQGGGTVYGKIAVIR